MKADNTNSARMLMNYAAERIELKIRKLILGSKWRHVARAHRKLKLIRHQDSFDVHWGSRNLGVVNSPLVRKNAYCGACFIVGAGPSLNDVDVSLLRDYGTITLNGAVLRFKDFGLMPRHHIMVSRGATAKHFELAREPIQNGVECYLGYPGIGIVCQHAPELIGRPNLHLIESIDTKHDQPMLKKEEFYERYKDVPGIYLSEKNEKKLRRVGFSTVGELGFFGSRTVAVWAIQLAVFLGYSRIYLIGTELGATGHHHFYEEGESRQLEADIYTAPPPTFGEAFDFDIGLCLELARQVCDARGVELVNLTPHSLITPDIIPRRKLDDVLTMLSSENRTS